MPKFLADKAFEKYNPPKIDIPSIYEGGEGYQPIYSFSTKENKEKFRAEVKILEKKFIGLCEVQGLRESQKSSFKNFIYSLLCFKEEEGRYQNESDVFFADIKLYLERILYFFLNDEQFKEKIKKKLEDIIEELDACGAGVYNAFRVTNDDITNEKYESLTLYLQKIRKKLVEQTIQDLISQKKLPKLREGILIHVKMHFENLAETNLKWNILDKVIADGTIDHLIQRREWTLSEKHNKLFLKELENRYDFNFILDQVAGEARKKANDLINYWRDPKGINVDVGDKTERWARWFITNVDTKVSSIIDVTDVTTMRVKTPAFIVIKHLFEEGIFDKNEITNYDKEVKPLLEKLIKRINDEERSPDLEKDFLSVIGELAKSNNDNDKKLAERLAADLIEYTLEYKADGTLNSVISELFSDGNDNYTKNVVIEAINNLASRDNKSPLFSSELVGNLVSFLSEQKKQAPKMIGEIIQNFAQLNNEGQVNVLTNYATGLDDETELKKIIASIKGQQNLQKFCTHLFFAKSKKDQVVKLEAIKNLKDQLYNKSSFVDYDVVILKAGGKLPADFKKITVVFEPYIRAGLNCTIYYPASEYRKEHRPLCVEGFDEILYDKQSEDNEKIIKLKNKISSNKTLIKDAFEVTSLDQVIKTLMASQLPAEKWREWLELSGGLKIVKNNIKNIEDLENLLKKRFNAKGYVHSFCQAIFKKDPYNIDLFIKKIIKNGNDIDNFMYLLSEGSSVCGDLDVSEVKAIANDKVLMAYFLDTYGGEAGFKNSNCYKRFQGGRDPVVTAEEIFTKAIRGIIEQRKKTEKWLQKFKNQGSNLFDNDIRNMCSQPDVFIDYITITPNLKSTFKVFLINKFLAGLESDKLDQKNFDKLYSVILKLRDKKNKQKLLSELISKSKNIKIRDNKTFRDIFGVINIAKDILDILKITDQEVINNNCKIIFNSFEKISNEKTKTDVLKIILGNVNPKNLKDVHFKKISNFLLNCEYSNFEEFCKIFSGKEDRGIEKITQNVFVKSRTYKANILTWLYYLILSMFSSARITRIRMKSKPQLPERLLSLIEHLDNDESKIGFLKEVLDNTKSKEDINRIFKQTTDIISSINNMQKADLLLRLVEKFKPGEIEIKKFNQVLGLVKLFPQTERKTMSWRQGLGDKKSELIKKLLEKSNLKEIAKNEELYSSLHDLIKNDPNLVEQKKSLELLKNEMSVSKEF